MDDIARRTDQLRLQGESEIWSKARKLLRQNPPRDFLAAVRRGKSVNWLAHILRDQGFAFGLPEGNRSYPDNRWLTREELDECIGAMTTRFEKLGMRKIFSLPAPLDVLFCWVQLGDADEVKLRFAEATKTDTKLVRALNALCGWSNSSNRGIYHPLAEEYIAYFADPAVVRGKLEAIGSKGRQVPASLRTRARELLDLWTSPRGGTF
jgi:hypothetical protein